MIYKEILCVWGEGLGEEKEEEDGCFTLLNVFEACNTCPSEFGSLRRANPAPIFLLQ